MIGRFVGARSGAVVVLAGALIALSPMCAGSVQAQTPTPSPTPNLTPPAGSGSARVYVSSGADTVSVIDTGTQAVLAVIPVRASAPPQPGLRFVYLAATVDGSRVYVLAGDTLSVIDARTVQLTKIIPLSLEGLAIAAGPDDHTVYVASVGRIRRIDAESGVISSVLTPTWYGPFAFAPDGKTLVAATRKGNPCDSQAGIAVVDTATGQTLATADTGVSAGSIAFSAAGSLVYVTDWCRNAVEVVDVQSTQVVGVLPVEYEPARIAIAADGTRAYTSHSQSSWFLNPDGSYGPEQGWVSAIDLTRGSSTTIKVPGRSDRLALTPDGSLLYVTETDPTTRNVAVIDTATSSLLTTLILDGVPTDVAAAPAPPAAAPPPQNPSGVLLRADDVAGVPGDVVPFGIRLDTHGQAVAAVAAELLSSFNAQFLGGRQPGGPPDCVLAPDIDATATFDFDPPSCWPPCSSVRLAVRSNDPAQSLPSGTLLTCFMQIMYGYHQYPSVPVFLLNATATDPEGTPLALTTADGSVTLLSRDEATPRPTRTPPPTPTPTVIPTVTATALPAVVSVDSIEVPAGTTRAVVTVRLRAESVQVAGTQNDLSFPSAAPVTANPDGSPACVVNPAIDKPATTFAFLPRGRQYCAGAKAYYPDVQACAEDWIEVPPCRPEQGECNAVRTLVLAIDNLDTIANGAVLYSCEVRLLDAKPGASLPFRITKVYASDPKGNAVPVAGEDGVLAIADATWATPTTTPADAGTDGRLLSAVTADPAQQPASHAGGCAITDSTVRAPDACYVAVIAIFIMRRRHYRLRQRAA